MLRVNVTGAFLCARAVVGAMRRAKWGRIINMASGAVTLGRPNYLHYIASKAALDGMTRSLARELGPHGITVNAILPGATFTEIERKTVTPEQKERIVAMQCIARPEEPRGPGRHRPVPGLRRRRFPDRPGDHGGRRRHASLGQDQPGHQLADVVELLQAEAGLHHAVDLLDRHATARRIR